MTFEQPYEFAGILWTWARSCANVDFTLTFLVPVRQQEQARGRRLSHRSNCRHVVDLRR
jgi:hypothetical protein